MVRHVTLISLYSLISQQRSEVCHVTLISLYSLISQQRYGTVTYLELAQKALRKARDAGQLPSPDAKPQCEESEKSPVAAQEDDDRETCRIIERDLGLTPGSLALWGSDTHNLERQRL
jgi:hypothetical protein